jgi:hypothetical protein
MDIPRALRLSSSSSVKWRLAVGAAEEPSRRANTVWYDDLGAVDRVM